jgi:hypothetical protein
MITAEDGGMFIELEFMDQTQSAEDEPSGIIRASPE